MLSPGSYRLTVRLSSAGPSGAAVEGMTCMIPTAPAEETTEGCHPLSCQARPMTRYGLTPCFKPAAYSIDLVIIMSSDGPLGSEFGSVCGQVDVSSTAIAGWRPVGGAAGPCERAS